ncbi:MAG: tail fiber protein [Betaproteobacteria bacterium]
MASPFIGEIKMFGGNFVPRNYAFCNGQLIAIAQNTALFSLLGTTYGGNGTSTYALPNLQGRAPMQQGQGPGLSDQPLGAESGTPTVTLTSAELPSHNHGALCTTATAALGTPIGNSWAPGAGRSASSLYSSTAPNTNMSSNAVGAAGQSQPHNNLQPYLAVSFIIALQGIFPARN